MTSFTYRWNIKDLEKVEKNGLKVFSCFACGGGSSFGYKMSGCEVIGCNEIDPEMMAIYRENHHPKYSYLEGIQTFKKRNDLPKELFELDILDGSPPCSSFSMAGSREKTWGKKKVFREGQAEQVLDDLFFHFIDLANKLQPKVVIAENVKGLIQGNAKGYVKQIINLFKVSGYDVQLFLLNAASMGVPQRRERVFFIAKRKDLSFPEIKLGWNERPISVKESIKDLNIRKSDYSLKHGTLGFLLWSMTKEGESFSLAHLRLRGKAAWYGSKKINPSFPMLTLVPSSDVNLLHWEQPRCFSAKEWARFSSFPGDYKYKNEKTGRYLMGMSVPPLMIHKITEQLKQQWFFKKENNYGQKTE